MSTQAAIQPVQVGAGRPTKYDPSVCQRVLELGARGYSKIMMAAELGVVRQTLENWAATHPDFREAMARARDLSQAWWEAQGQAGIWSREFNAAAYRLQMTNRFPEDWRDRRSVDWQGVLSGIRLESLPDEALQRIADGEHPLSVLASLSWLDRASALGPGDAETEPAPVE